ncbi:unnamed protein product [Prorocentrum cordatum]|uniref:Uncharacterized protein n=1 Tax=Prorocentrum cordatum TaxID=2364126 RepID=A0ABN9XBP9_9DINO|nr:unnamed protein product [Polarella glacialis]
MPGREGAGPVRAMDLRGGGEPAPAEPEADTEAPGRAGLLSSGGLPDAAISVAGGEDTGPRRASPIAGTAGPRYTGLLSGAVGPVAALSATGRVGPMRAIPGRDGAGPARAVDRRGSGEPAAA